MRDLDEMSSSSSALLLRQTQEVGGGKTTDNLTGNDFAYFVFLQLCARRIRSNFAVLRTFDRSIRTPVK